MNARAIRALGPTLLALSCAAAALPAHAIDDRLTLRASAFQADATTELQGRTLFQGRDFTFEESFEGDDVVPRFEGELKFGERHRLVFNYLDYDRDQRESLDEPISFDGITIPAGSVAFGDMKFRLAGLAYDFAVVETPTVSVGLQLGVQYARLEGRLRAESGLNVYDERGEENGALPVLGLRAGFAPADAWRVVLQGQHFDRDWVNLEDTRGSLTRANALVEYRFNERFGVHAGYDWFRVEAQDEGGDGLIGLEQRLQGPMAGLTLSF